ncbi:MAG: sulfate adenylyltransferase [Crocinitomix sp.]|nr:sulfate adenylyltransferase [Crocinitomix sp.]
MELFRFLTAGSVDDGKSTLIGHLLHLVKALKADQISKITALSEGDEVVNYAWFTDGLKSERELGITIDVSYQYFSTAARRFIIADCPGHKEYTRNMFTGASTADLLVLMVNVENGITEQTRRHLKIGQLLQLPNILICINKMDLVDYDEKAFNQLKSDFSEIINPAEANHFFIPVSATKGDNLAEKSDRMKWYEGATLLAVLNNAKKIDTTDDSPCFPVQVVLNHENETHILGNVFDGELNTGDTLFISSSEKSATISKIYQANKHVNTIKPGEYGSLVIDTDYAIKRGDILARKKADLQATKTIKAKCCWMDETSLQFDKSYILKLSTQEVSCMIKSVIESDKTNERVDLNTIFTAELETEVALITKPYVESKTLGTFIVIDPTTNQTVAAGTIL